MWDLIVLVPDHCLSFLLFLYKLVIKSALLLYLIVSIKGLLDHFITSYEPEKRSDDVLYIMT